MLSVRVYIILDLVRCVGVNLEPFQPEDWKAGIIDGKARQTSMFRFFSRPLRCMG